MGATLHAAGVHQHVGLLDAPARGRMRQATQPAVGRLGRGQRGGGGTQRRVQRPADVVEQDVGPAPQAAGGAQIGVRVFLIPQVADHKHPQMAQWLRGDDKAIAETDAAQFEAAGARSGGQPCHGPEDPSSP